MEFIHNINDISVYSDEKAVIAQVKFESKSDTTVEVVKTFVDESLQGQGVAGKLMEELAKNLEKTNRKAVLSCGYSAKWFSKHPELSALIED